VLALHRQRCLHFELGRHVGDRFHQFKEVKRGGYNLGLCVVKL
jgi:hypothetical protein